ncbi:TonB-dependent copper receptor [Parashewanella tropica]|uniref:TonB-dependent copper receptor n=1 Tax=Parashewanella tropica TaxID=2547970 RepID=UPI00105A8C22|nr:TonB-dependent copper receptor [Parashewanella tropica]
MKKVLTLSVAISTALSNSAFAETDLLEQDHKAKNVVASKHQTTKTEDIEHIVVTGEYMQQPTTVSTNPKQPRLPLPAYDGAGYLKTIAGFSIGRKGGAGGEPSLRGLGGSRINIIDDGQHTYGTCGGRMDPPTAYVYPESYDSIEVIKGPQTVKYGPVGSAGTVLFEKDHVGYTEQTAEGRVTATGASFGREDYLAEFRGGNKTAYLDFELNSSRSDHYEDGSGNKIQSKYDRKNSSIALGWTPSEDTVAELSYSRSDGSAEYADRANKGRVIENKSTNLLIQHDVNGKVFDSFEFQVYANRTNHIMDQFDKGKGLGINVRRATQGGHAWFDLSLSESFSLVTGVDFMLSKHEGRVVRPTDEKNSLDDLLQKPFNDNAKYSSYGVFAESNYELAGGNLISGVRLDHWKTELFVAQKGKRTDDLFSGFTRYEISKGNHQYYAGVGHSNRIPDYWEIMKKNQSGAGKAFDLETEKTTQLDIGWIYDDEMTISTSLYFGKVDDYIAINDKYVARNVDATIFGGELAIKSPITEHISTQVIVSYSHGQNDTDDKPLGQVSPLEGKIALDYSKDEWSFGLLWRLVAAQNRVAIGDGNISGRDLAKSKGFGTLAVFGGWKANDAFSVNFGIENLLDKTYAEHISRPAAGNDIPGSEPLFQVNEPGLNGWVKLNYAF